MILFDFPTTIERVADFLSNSGGLNMGMVRGE